MSRPACDRSSLPVLVLALAGALWTARGALADSTGAPAPTAQPPAATAQPPAATRLAASHAASSAAAIPARRPARRRRTWPPWTQTSSGEGITTFKREVPGSDVIALRGIGTVDAPIVRVASVLLDYTRAPEWIDSLEFVRVVRMVGPLEFIEHDHVGTPPIIMKDRDFVCRGRLALDLAAQSLVMTIEPAIDARVPPDDSCVRGELRGYWKLEAIDGGKHTRVTAEMHGDPKGGVPKWLVNLFQKGWARSTIEALREQVAKPDIEIMPQVKAAFEGKPIDLAIKSK